MTVQAQAAESQAPSHEDDERTEARVIRTITRRLIPFLILLYTVAYVDRSVLGFAKLQLSADIGLSNTAYGFGAGLFFIGYFLFEVPSNLILSRIGARRWFARILLSWGAVTVAMAAIRTPAAFYVLRFMLGAAEAGLYPGIIYYLTRWYPQRHLGRVLGLFLMAQPLALILTGPLSGALLSLDGTADLRGWQWLFLVSGLPAILLVLPTLFYLPDQIGTARWLSPKDRAWLDRKLQDERPGAGDQKVRSMPQILFDPRVVRLGFAFLPFPLAIYGLTLWLPTILTQAVTSPLMVGLLFAVPYLFSLFALRIVPRWSDRSGERHRYVIGNAVLAATALALSAMLPGNLLAFAALCVAAFGLYGGQSVFWTLPARFLSGREAAIGIAFINSLGNLGGYIGPFAVGAIKDLTGELTGGIAFMAGSLILTVLLIAFDSKHGSRA